MNLFNKKTGGFMDEIRCDERDFLVWKWHPSGKELNNNNRENAIRWGSSLRVKEGEVAIFVYKDDTGKYIDYIEGPYDEILKTRNLPIIAQIIGTLYEGGTPFQAEIYFINLAKTIQFKFGVPYFNIFEKRFSDFGVPVALRGTLTFCISDYKQFIKINRLQNFSLEDLQKQIRDALILNTKKIVFELMKDKDVSIYQIEGQIDEVEQELKEKVLERMENQFGIKISSIDISNIEINKASSEYVRFKSLTTDIEEATIKTQTEANLRKIRETNRIELENMEDMLRRQREETQYATHMRTRSANIDVYQTEAQTQVGVAGAEALGKMGANGAGDINLSESGFNPATMMAGMALGGAVGQNIAGTMNNIMNTGQLVQTPPIQTETKYYVAKKGKAIGPFDIKTIQQMINMGDFLENTLVWKKGMENWEMASKIEDLSDLFMEMPPVPNENK